MSRRALEKYPNAFFVETGTFMGDGIQDAINNGFKTIFSYEVSKSPFESSCERFKNNKNVTILFKPSQTMYEEIKNINSEITFWLDGHWSSGNSLTSFHQVYCPLLDELNEISKHPIKTHTILVDDVRCFGTEEFQFLSEKEVRDKILSINPKYQFKYENGYQENDILVAYIPKYSGPYKDIPQELLVNYTQNNKIPILNWWFDSTTGSTSLEKPNWDDEYIQTARSNFSIEKIKNNTVSENYQRDRGSYNLLSAFEKYGIANKNVAVVGSTSPWVEAILLNLGNTVTTVEYNVPISNIIKCISYDQFVQSIDEYDCIVSYSSIEHSGLGRYGDQLDPNGDIKAMNEMYKHLKSNGLVILGIPVGKDALVWNAHRIYGNVRLPLVCENFQDLEWFGYDKSLLNYPLNHDALQPVIVLKKIDKEILTILGKKYGTDKVSHGFCNIYEKYFSPIRQNIKNFLEIGIFFGASIQMWKEYFENAQIHGMDTFMGKQGNGTFFPNADKYYNEWIRNRDTRIELYKYDQSKQNDLAAFICEMKMKNLQFDIILDDASHLMYDQQISLSTLFDLVTPGGYYVIEDVHSSYDDYDVLPDLSNTTVTMVNNYLKTGKLTSVYADMSQIESQIEKIELINGTGQWISNRTGLVEYSCTCMIKKR